MSLNVFSNKHCTKNLVTFTEEILHGILYLGPFSNFVTPEGWEYGHFFYELLRKFMWARGGS